MKYLWLVWLLCTVPEAFGQSAYAPFLNRSQWFVQEDGAGFQNFPWFSHPQDTLIQGINWKKVYRDNSGKPCFVRENRADRTVFVTSANAGWQPHLLYDFKIIPGDTLSLRFLSASASVQSFSCFARDSVNTAMGFMPRIRLVNEDSSGVPQSLDWIEGVGADSHPFYLFSADEAFPVYHLICSWQNGSKVYDDGFGTCPNSPPPVGIDDPGNTGSLAIFPNPSSGAVRVKLPSLTENATLEIYDCLGRRCYRQTLPARKTELLLHPGSLPEGQYYLRLTGPSGIFFSASMTRLP